MRGQQPTRRLFFALWPDESLRVALADATHEAAEACDGRPVPNHNLHATLLFLGSVAESRIAELQAIAAAAMIGPPPAGVGLPPELIFDHIELWQKARVLVAATRPSPGLEVATALAMSLQRETHRAGFAPDPRPFRAHVTLARKVARVGRVMRMHPVRWSLADFVLVESRTESTGAVYRVLESFPVFGRRE